MTEVINAEGRAPLTEDEAYDRASAVWAAAVESVEDLPVRDQAEVLKVAASRIDRTARRLVRRTIQMHMLDREG